jgi:long-chain fatty acid transport protein
MVRSRRLRLLLGLSVTVALAAGTAARAQQGISLAGTGPINLSFGGATTAAPLDASGALYWNPATLMGLQRNTLDVGMALIYPQTRLSSGVPANAVLPGVPATAVGDGERGDNGVFPLPGFAINYKSDDDVWSVGLGAFAVGGFGTNFPGNTNSPILSARFPQGFAQGPIYTQLQVVDVVGAGAMRLTDHLSVGFAPVLALALLQEDPGIFAVPDTDPTTGTPVYPSLTHTRINWGAGFHAGLYYETEQCWRFGLSYRSTQWFDSFRYHDSDPQGLPRNDKIRADFPAIASAGVSYAGLERWLFAADVRYVDYKNTKGFSEGGFNPDGSLAGLGWRSIFVVALGAQYQATDCLTLRSGYTFNQNPAPDLLATENAGSMAIGQHTLWLGGSYRIHPNVLLSAAYVHVFANGITGPLVLPGIGTVPGSFVRDELTGVDTFIGGITVQF